MRRRAATALRLVILLAVPAAAFAQPEPPAATHDRAISVAVGYEVRADRLRYTFENPSNVDTEFLVPHSFTQSYDARNGWLKASVRYPIGPDRFATEIGITPERVTHGSDFDTFYDPGNDVIVYGTDGEVELRSFEITQWSHATLFGLPWRAGYRYRRDRSQFLPTDRIVTHSNPAREERSPTFGHETTISEVHEIPIEVSRQAALHDWTLRVNLHTAPLIWGHLTTILPDKYPDRDIVYNARALGYGAGIDVQRAMGSVSLIASVRYERTWSYSAARELTLNGLRIGVTLER